MINKKFWDKAFVMGGRLVVLGGIAGLAFTYAKQNKNHANIVIENKNNELLIEDVNTKEQRTVSYEHGKGKVYEFLDAFVYFEPGDTINIKKRESEYVSSRHLSWDCIDFYPDSLRAREIRVNQQKKIDTKQR